MLGVRPMESDGNESVPVGRISRYSKPTHAVGSRNNRVEQPCQDEMQKQVRHVFMILEEINHSYSCLGFAMQS